MGGCGINPMFLWWGNDMFLQLDIECDEFLFYLANGQFFCLNQSIYHVYLSIRNITSSYIYHVYLSIHNITFSYIYHIYLSIHNITFSYIYHINLSIHNITFSNISILNITFSRIYLSITLRFLGYIYP